MRTLFDRRVCAVSLLLLLGLSSIGLAQSEPEGEKAVQVLRDLGVDPTREGIGKFLDAVAKGEHASVSAREADELIARLGSDDFDVREQTTKRLSAMIFPPVQKLEEAAKHNDFEVARRSQVILTHLSARPDPIVALFQTVRARAIPVTALQIRPVLTACEQPASLAAAQDALVVAVGKDDLEQVRKWMEDKDWRVKVAAVRALGAIRRENAVPELEKLLESKDPKVSGAAARALVDLGQALDYKKYTAVLDTESQVSLLRIAEKRFRQENRDKRDKPAVMQEYQKLLSDYAAALTKAKNVKQEKKGRQDTPYWLNLGLDTSKHPEVLMYRIQWSGGTWSDWCVPGFNDREMGKGRNIRLWAFFSDHTYEIITTSDKTKHREVQDLP
jgi:hypothetical protein